MPKRRPGEKAAESNPDIDFDPSLYSYH